MIKVNYSYNGKSKTYQEPNELKNRRINSVIESAQLSTFSAFAQFCQIPVEHCKLKIRGATTATGLPRAAHIEPTTRGKVKSKVGKKVKFIKLGSRNITNTDSQINISVELLTHE